MEERRRGGNGEREGRVIVTHPYVEVPNHSDA